jgi:hypothetical protein
MEKVQHPEVNSQLAPFDVGGTFHCQLVRKGVVIDEWDEKNIVVNEGLNDLLQVYLGNGTQKPTWYVGLFETSYTPVAGDTAASHGMTESTAYTEATRPEWVEAAAASQQITNSANKATFTINASKTIYGAFLVSSNVKGGAAGVLFAASKFSVSRAVIADDQLLITYTVQAASA